LINPAGEGRSRRYVTTRELFYRTTHNQHTTHKSIFIGHKLNDCPFKIYSFTENERQLFWAHKQNSRPTGQQILQQLNSDHIFPNSQYGTWKYANVGRSYALSNIRQGNILSRVWRVAENNHAKSIHELWEGFNRIYFKVSRTFKIILKFKRLFPSVLLSACVETGVL
jgi:hypothetical protein